MMFHPTALPGVLMIEPERQCDDRGHFSRTFCRTEFAAHGLFAEFVQTSASVNTKRGTLRGLHYQAPPAAETKLVRVVRGAAFDVAVDLRRNSVTYGRWVAERLSAENGRMLYIPPGCAHGFQTLADDTELLYQIAPDYQPGLSRGVRWNDPTLRIAWPIADPILSERDRCLPILAALAAA
jgi:dTDP-4-dehydrorhamnose 3,5-epimerase